MLLLLLEGQAVLPMPPECDGVGVGVAMLLEMLLTVLALEAFDAQEHPVNKITRH